MESKLKTLNWKAQNEELLSGLTGQSASSYMIQVFVLLAVLLGISSVLAISVVQNPDGTPLVPFYLDYTFITLSVIVAIVASTIASVIPARKSSKLNPIEVIRNG